jgi:hypothetical protein
VIPWGRIGLAYLDLAVPLPAHEEQNHAFLHHIAIIIDHHPYRTFAAIKQPPEIFFFGRSVYMVGRTEEIKHGTGIAEI